MNQGKKIRAQLRSIHIILNKNPILPRPMRQFRPRGRLSQTFP